MLSNHFVAGSPLPLFSSIFPRIIKFSKLVSDGHSRSVVPSDGIQQ